MVERTLISFPSQLQLIERLQHLLYLSSSMVFISGEKGSGKSTLIEQLSNQLPNKTQQAFVTLSEPSSIIQVRQQIVSQLFEQPLFDADDSLTNSFLLLKEKQNEDVARVVVIDNAELLPEQIVIELAEIIKQKTLFTEHEISFILISDESTNKKFVEMINSSAGAQAIATLTFKLPPLSDNEAKQLINHRFSQVGYLAQLQHQDALTKQLLACQGIPEKILALAANLSSGKLETSKPSWLKTRFPAILLMILLVVIAGVLTSYLYPLFIKNSTQPEILIEEEVELLEDIQVSEIIAGGQSEGESTELLAGKWSNDNNSIENNQLSVGKADSSERVIITESEIVKLVASNAQKTELSAEEAITPTLAISPISDIVEKAIVSEKPAIDKPTVAIIQPIPPQNPAVEAVETPVVISEPVVQPVAELSHTEISKETEAVVLQELPESQGPAQLEKLESLQEAKLKEPQLKPKNNNTAFTDPTQLLDVNSDIYTLQLSGMSTEKSLKEFINQHQLPRKNTYLYQTVRNGKPWYVVIYGQFKNRQTADKVAKKLPGSLAKLDSWVKKYASVHRDILLNE